MRNLYFIFIVIFLASCASAIPPGVYQRSADGITDKLYVNSEGHECFYVVEYPVDAFGSACHLISNGNKMYKMFVFDITNESSEEVYIFDITYLGQSLVLNEHQNINERPITLKYVFDSSNK
ncbi:hypothetical protein [Pseudaeromonas paramecii]|uniref:Lipoprotein n=1 Tax=Pseudaeromonas paramecii TaxID=2138166 RepID=A0ABP8QG14_9GAMM